MKKLLISCWIAGTALCRGAPAAPESWDVQSDTWVATDALGRTLPGYAECGPPRPDRVVGIFYFLWLGQHGTSGPFDITKLLAADPAQPQWGPAGAFHHWGESELGYYLSDDEYVIRRHCELLADALIDLAIFDVTNGFTYSSVVERLCAVYQKIRAEGNRTPQVCFLLHSGAPAVAQKLYEEFYSKNLYPELWFRWQGKPLILASPEGQSAAVRGFFNFRESWAWSGSAWFGDGRDKWPWLDNYPQKYGWHDPGVPEEVSVCAAQHPTSNIGRSFHDGRQPAPGEFKTAEGLCFAEQWRKALELDPRFIFITGWNEWVAQRFLAKGGEGFLGQRLAAGESFFVDEYNQEYSRDLEPMKGGHTDNYYYQMMAQVRRFKGVGKPPATSPLKAIAVDGEFSDWADVQPEFRDTRGDTAHRNQPGWGSAGTYANTTGRNDLARMKVARDDQHVYFYAETAGPLTSPTGKNWMLLFIDIDSSKGTGWSGYDFRVNAPVIDATATTLSKRGADGQWIKVQDVPYRAAGNQLELRLARADLGLAGKSEFAFEFHWADNLTKAEDLAEFFTDGDSAPNRRANYRYDAR